MTLQATLDLLRAILADLPAAITTGRELMLLLNRAIDRLGETASGEAVSRADIERLANEIRAASERIQQID
jgi:multidrug resistance efflux pump